MRVVITDRISHPGGKGVLFRKGSLAYARQQASGIEVRDPREVDRWHKLGPDLVEPVELDSPFDFMASPARADQAFSPIEVEHQVQDYLRKLDEALLETSFAPTARVRALVFGQWGHGKSMVMYRTASHLTRRHASALVLRVVPEILTPIGILKAVVSDLRSRGNLDAEALSALEAKRPDLEKARDDRKAGRILAKALVALAKKQGALHTCLLVDEGQTGARKSFLRFLKEIEDAFAREELLLHTLQCHTWSSIQRVKELAAELSELLRNAQQIHLPSISEAQAGEFFRERIRHRTKASAYAVQKLAQQLVPDGVARSLCRVAGGNPRRMLQYAGRILEASNKASEAHFTGDRVLDVLGQEEHPKRIGQPLFDQGALDRVLQLLPQVFRNGGSLARFIREHIGTLLGESEPVRPKDLLGELDMTLQQATNLLEREVDGTLILQARQIVDEEDDDEQGTVFELASDFRSRLFPVFGSSGSLDRKQAQYQVFLNPLALQKRSSDGLATILNLERQTSAPPTPVRLGQESDYPLAGHELVMQVAGANTVAVPVLVCCLVQVSPPAEFVEHVVRGIKDRRWARVFVLHYHDKQRWEQWSAREGRKHLKDVAKSPRKIVPLEYAEWKELELELDGEEGTDGEAARAARLFGDLACEDNTVKPPQDAERRRFYEGVSGLFQEHRPTLRDVCYLPTQTEQAFLDDPHWGPPGERTETTRTKLSKLGDRPVKAAQLHDLLGDYIEQVGNRYRRREPRDSQLWKAISEELKERGGEVKLADIREAVEERLILDDHPERVQSCLEWILDQMVDSGVAEQVGTETYRHADLLQSIRKRQEQVDQLLAEAATRVEAIKRYSTEDLQQLIDSLEERTHARTSLDNSSLREKLNKLDSLLGDAQLLLAHLGERESAIDSEKKSLVSTLEQALRQLEATWAGVEEPLRQASTLVEDLSRLQTDLATYRALTDSATERNLKHQLEDEFRILNRAIKRFSEHLEPIEKNQTADTPQKARDLLLRVLSSKQNFEHVRVTVEVVEA